MGLFLSFKDNRELIDQLRSGKVLKEVYEYIDDRKKENIIINRNNIFNDFEAEIRDTQIYCNSKNLEDPFDNPVALSIHDEILKAYDRYERKNHIQSVSLSTDMSAYEIYNSMKHIVAFEKVRKGYYMDYLINDLQIDYSCSDIIYDVAENTFRKYDTDLSLDSIINSITMNIKDRTIKLEELKELTSHEVLQGVIENNFSQFSTLSTDKIEKITLKEMLEKANVLKDDRIYELSQDDLKEFVNRYVDNEYIPLLRVFSDCTAFDNTANECFGEDFDCREKALKYLTGYSADEVEEIFQRFTQSDKLEKDEEYGIF